MIKVMIADDHILIREGLKKICATQNDIKVVADTESPFEIIDLLNKNEVDVLLLDINMPNKNGLEALKEIKAFKPVVKVLILSIHPEDRYAVRALKAGASGYISKNTDPMELIRAIRKIADGHKYISSELAEKLAQEVGVEKKSKGHELLSDREYQVFRLIAEGKSQHNIADDLALGISTVNTYRSRILDKLNLKSNAEIIYYAIENKLID